MQTAHMLHFGKSSFTSRTKDIHNIYNLKRAY